MPHRCRKRRILRRKKTALTDDFISLQMKTFECVLLKFIFCFYDKNDLFFPRKFTAQIVIYKMQYIQNIYKKHLAQWSIWDTTLKINAILQTFVLARRSAMFIMFIKSSKKESLYTYIFYIISIISFSKDAHPHFTHLCVRLMLSSFRSISYFVNNTLHWKVFQIWNYTLLLKSQQKR